MWNHLMSQMQCCGVDGYKDFDESDKWVSGRNRTVVPSACCVMTDAATFKLKDPYCPNAPSSSNSYKDKVRLNSCSLLLH